MRTILLADSSLPLNSQSVVLSTPVNPKARVENVPLGILCMILATMAFAVSNLIAKLLVTRYPIGEVMAFRSIVSLAICASVILPFTGMAVFRTRRPRDHVARGLSQSISQTFTIIALSLMPLGGAIAISFSAPLFAAVLSLIWLKERADPARWAMLLVGFLGVMFVTNPGGSSLQIGTIFALANAVMYGSVTVAVRRMATTESTETLLMWQMVTVAGFQSCLLFLGFKLPLGADIGMLIGMGIANGVAQFLWTKALHLAPATAVSPFYYLLLVWSLLLGFFVWGEIPSLTLLIGVAILVGSGSALLWRETMARNRLIAQQNA